MAFVHDEYGHFEGIVTPADLLIALAGEFASDKDLVNDPPLVERDVGSFWISGSSWLSWARPPALKRWLKDLRARRWTAERPRERKP